MIIDENLNKIFIDYQYSFINHQQSIIIYEQGNYIFGAVGKRKNNISKTFSGSNFGVGILNFMHHETAERK